MEGGGDGLRMGGGGASSLPNLHVTKYVSIFSFVFFSVCLDGNSLIQSSSTYIHKFNG